MTPSTKKIKNRTSPRLPWRRKLLDDKKLNKRAFVGPNLFVKTRPFFSEKGYWMVLKFVICWITKLTDSYYWYFLFSWHPDFDGNCDWIRLLEPDILFWWKHASLAMKNMWLPAFAHPEKTSRFKNKHRSETVWTETLHGLYSRIVLCCCQHRDFFQSADFYRWRCIPNIPLAKPPTQTTN